MAHAVMTSMMAKIDELKEQMTDGAYLALCDELMRLHASTPPEAPATPPITEREPQPQPEPEPEPQVIDEDDYNRSVVERARQIARDLGRPEPFPHLPI